MSFQQFCFALVSFQVFISKIWSIFRNWQEFWRVSFPDSYLFHGLQFWYWCWFLLCVQVSSKFQPGSYYCLPIACCAPVQHHHSSHGSHDLVQARMLRQIGCHACSCSCTVAGPAGISSWAWGLSYRMLYSRVTSYFQVLLLYHTLQLSYRMLHSSVISNLPAVI